MTRETRLESLLTEILDRLERFIDRANANDELDIVAVSMRATVQSAVEYLFENGLTADAKRLKNSADCLLQEAIGIPLYDVAKKLPTEEKEARVEFYGLSLLAADDPETREYRLRGIVGSAVQLRDLVEEILADIKADGLVDEGEEPGASSLDLEVGAYLVSELAEHFGLPQNALRKRLDRWREQNPGHDGWLEHPERKPREQKYLYRPTAVMKPVIEPLLAKAKKATGETTSE